MPLTDWTRSVLKRLEPFNGFGKSKARLDEVEDVRGWVHHDLRRTFSTSMAMLRVPIHVTEALLAHRSGSVSGVAATYNRYNYQIEIREALEAYEAWLKQLVR